jgi:nitrite reductase (NO-forming)
MLDGKGIPGTYPPLYNSDYMMEDKERSIEITLNGMDGEITVNGETYSGSMEKLEMTDEEIAFVLTFLRTKMGNSGDAVTVEEVRRIRNRAQKK